MILNQNGNKVSYYIRKIINTLNEYSMHKSSLSSFFLRSAMKQPHQTVPIYIPFPGETYSRHPI